MISAAAPASCASSTICRRKHGPAPATAMAPVGKFSQSVGSHPPERIGRPSSSTATATMGASMSPDREKIRARRWSLPENDGPPMTSTCGVAVSLKYGKVNSSRVTS